MDLLTVRQHPEHIRCATMIHKNGGYGVHLAIETGRLTPRNEWIEQDGKRKTFPDLEYARSMLEDLGIEVFVPKEGSLRL